MKILNLVDIEKSDIKYQISRFPDGQQNIVIDRHSYNNYGPESSSFYIHKVVYIKSRLNNWLDLELIICAVASLRELGVEEIYLYVPYIVGARSDRKFKEGGNNYIKDVIAPVINSLNFKSVICIDPHSDVLEACIKGFRKESNLKLLTTSLFGISKEIAGVKGIYSGMLNKSEYLDKFILISPDAGASKKIYKLAEQIGYKGDIIICSKSRDEQGKLSRIEVPLSVMDLEKDVIIIDDICDGGATFINIAKELNKHDGFESKIYLIVTHGIFSKGFEELNKYFDSIYCTNSYKDIPKDYEFGTGSGIFLPDLVKQLNVF